MGDQSQPRCLRTRSTLHRPSSVGPLLERLQIQDKAVTVAPSLAPATGGAIPNTGGRDPAYPRVPRDTGMQAHVPHDRDPRERI